jgi:hypothetical protein
LIHNGVCRRPVFRAESTEECFVRRTAWPWLILAVAAIAAFLTGPTGAEAGDRVVLLLVVAAVIAAIQCRVERPTNE